MDANYFKDIVNLQAETISAYKIGSRTTILIEEILLRLDRLEKKIDEMTKSKDELTKI